MPVYKDKGRDTWYAKFNYKDWNGEIKQKIKRGFKRERDAKAFEREFLAKTHASPSMSFGTLVSLYMDDCETRLKPTTFENKQYVINLKVLPFFKDMPINSIEPSTVRRWQNELIGDEKGYSQTYLKTVNNQLSAIFNYAMKYYKLPSNPARVCGSMGKKNADSMEFWTVDEFLTFLPAVSHKESTKVMYEVLFWTGIRIGEMLALTLSDFDFMSKTVSISKNFAKAQGKDLILDPKTPKSKRIITIPQFLCDSVSAYAEKLYDYDPTERLFPFSKSHLHTEMKRGVAKTGVKRIRIHDLRHSHASMLIEMGFSPLLISERLGHENVETTLQTYSHLYPNKHGQVADRIQDMMSERKNDIHDITEK